jgi:hypothetical protein
MCACKIYFDGQDKVFENTGQVITRDGLGRTRGRLEKDCGQYDHQAPVLCPCGCAAMYRRKVMDEAGVFDKYFFAYADDMDVGLRIRLLGYECLYIPRAVAYHILSSSFGLLSPFKVFLIERNRLWLAIKCFPLRHLIFLPFYTLARYFYHFYGMFLRAGPAALYVKKTSMLNLFVVGARVYLSTLWHLPRLIVERTKIRRARKVSSDNFEQWLVDFGISSRDAALSELSY